MRSAVNLACVRNGCPTPTLYWRSPPVWVDARAQNRSVGCLNGICCRFGVCAGSMRNPNFNWRPPRSALMLFIERWILSTNFGLSM